MKSNSGYYVVNGQIFLNKIQAILYANETLANVEWNFNRDILDMVDWTTEPRISLKDLYANRAKQIRDENDYVILMISGGADSTNMAYSFLDNNIKIDEIVASAPFSGLNNWKFDSSDTTYHGMISETKFAQLPLMHKISISHPQVRITLHDYFEDMISSKTDEWIYESLGHWIHLSGGTRHCLDKFTHIKNIAESGKKIAVVYGIDKPVICRSDSGNLYTVLMDTATTIVTSHFKDKYPNVESILYYYTADMPHLMVKQAHELCRWMYKSENSHSKNLMWNLSKSKEFNDHPLRGSKWQRSIVPCIYYPTIEHQNMWQADKQGPHGIAGGKKIDSWMYTLHKDSKMLQMIESDTKLLIHNINDKYFISKDLGFKMYMNYWKIGHESEFITNS
jgi:hypothetical protein